VRIAIFAETFLPKWDGVTNTLCYLLDHLAARGHESLMFAPQGAPLSYAQTPIIGLPSFRFPLYPALRLAKPTANVERELATFRPDVVHLANPASLGLVGLRAAQRLGTPAAASYQTDIPGYADKYGLPFLRGPIWAYFRWLHNQADLNLCPSRYTQSELAAHGFQRVRLWGRGVDANRVNPARRDPVWRARLSGGHPDAPLLLYVGRLAAEKRVDWLRPALDAIPQARLALVGDGPMRRELERLFPERTVFAGYLRGDDLARAYAAADLFVFPSANETFGNVILEAMASGLPVIAPSAGGPVDHVHNGKNGYLFRADCREELAPLAAWLIAHPAYLRELALGARRYAESQRWEVILDGLLEEYAAVIRNPLPRTTQARAAYRRRRALQRLARGGLADAITAALKAARNP